MSQACKTCNGLGAINTQSGVQGCPVCSGSGEQFDPGLQFMYEFGPQALTANQTLSSLTVQILDHSFKWMFAVFVSTGLFTVRISDAMAKRPFMNQQVLVTNFFGTAQNPMPLLTPFIFRQRSSILIDLTDISGAGNTVRLGFIGVELND